MNKKSIHENFLIDPFYPENGFEKNDRLKINNLPFYYENNHLLSTNDLKIPQNSDELITEMFKEWKEENVLLSAYFRERNRKLALEPMVRGLANLITINTWINDVMLTTLDNLLVDLDQLAIKPINLIERISFVLKQPDHYHSFIQLTGLYSELEKLYVKQKITSSK